MNSDPDVVNVVADLQEIFLQVQRRLRNLQGPVELSGAERSALSRLERNGPTTAAALARDEEISAQSMGATIAALEARALVQRRPDPHDGRRVVVSISAGGRKALAARRSAKSKKLAEMLEGEFTSDEIAQLAAAAPLLERLAGLL